MKISRSENVISTIKIEKQKRLRPAAVMTRLKGWCLVLNVPSFLIECTSGYWWSAHLDIDSVSIFSIVLSHHEPNRTLSYLKRTRPNHYSDSHLTGIFSFWGFFVGGRGLQLYSYNRNAERWFKKAILQDDMQKLCFKNDEHFFPHKLLATSESTISEDI